MIANFHNTVQGRRTIDAERRRLGQSLSDKWTEAEWIRQVPAHLRRDRQECGPVNGNQVRRSYSVYQRLLTEGRPTEWLDHSVLYLASAEYDIGVFIIYDSGYTPTSWYCERVGKDKEQHIVLFHRGGHYECVTYDGLSVFPSSHEFIVQMAQFAGAHPEQVPEDDVELQALEAREKEERALAIDQSPRLTVAAADNTDPVPILHVDHWEDSTINVAPQPAGDTESAPLLLATPRVAGRKKAAKRTPSTRANKSKAKRALILNDSAAAPDAEPDTASGSHDSIKQLPPLIAQVAEHGPLYERVSFHNHSQWRAANEPLWNAYRLASMTGQRGQLTPILLDILRLPQRVLPKLGRSGRAARRRAVAGTGRRLKSEAERLRARYDCPDPELKDRQQLQMSADTMADTVAQGAEQRPQQAALTAARKAIRRQAAGTTDDAADADTDADESARSEADSENEADEPFPSLNRLTRRHATDPDSKAARKADYFTQCGLTRKAAQVLHSTTQIADLRATAVQETMLRLHPQPPSGATLPTVPQAAPSCALEDDTGLRRLITQSDNGTAAGPSGWGGNMLAILERSDICRLGVIALLRDIINGELPDDARQLLASRLVALTKPSNDGYRPIAVGEVFYRLAAIVAVRRVSGEAASLLAPHQYGIGVAGGAEKILHSLQHELTDGDKRLSLLQLDITNAFNTCDRSRLLRELYGMTSLQSVFRIADFAYSQPSANTNPFSTKK